MRSIAFMILLTGCARDTMVGKWDGELICNGREYDVEARFEETSAFDYEGEMLFSYEEEVVVSGSEATFLAELLYEFTTHQTVRTGGQDIFLAMTWTKLFCEVEFGDGSAEEGGCLNVGGIDNSDKGEAIGYVEMRYSGSDRITVDDDNCEGSLSN